VTLPNEGIGQNLVSETQSAGIWKKHHDISKSIKRGVRVNISEKKRQKEKKRGGKIKKIELFSIAWCVCNLRRFVLVCKKPEKKRTGRQGHKKSGPGGTG